MRKTKPVKTGVSRRREAETLLAQRALDLAAALRQDDTAVADAAAEAFDDALDELNAAHGKACQ